jgi:hypothetical protein
MTLLTTQPVAALLASTAHALAAAGATADTVFPQYLTSVPPDLHTALSTVLLEPDRTSGHRVVHGVLSEFGDPGPTPPHWREGISDHTRALDIAVVLLSVSLGKIFGWAGQQDGRLVHNIAPSKGFEKVQVGASSTTELTWHTEDSFHPRRADLLLLACIRNNDNLGTRLSSIRRARLSDEHRSILSKPVTRIMPDDSYPEDWQTGDSKPMSTMWRDKDGWCLRYDPAYTQFLDDSPEFELAYKQLGASLDECAEDVVAGPGDVLLIDNDIAVHGRSPFKPRYDGTDRWLKRSLIHTGRHRPGEDEENGYNQVLIEP